MTTGACSNRRETITANDKQQKVIRIVFVVLWRVEVEEQDVAITMVAMCSLVNNARFNC
jgi:hypothetical protein